MALAYTAPTWTDGSGEGISASNLQAISNCIEGLVQGSDKAVHNVQINGSVITLTYADGTVENFTAVDIKGISSVEKTSTVGLVDTYTITYSDGTTSTFTVTNGSGSSIPNGSTITPTDDISVWLQCAGLHQDYTTLEQVLANSSVFAVLVNNTNAVDYMVRSTTWASTVCADSSAMARIGANDYCADILLGDSTWRTAICNSTYFENVLNVKVPTLTSASASAIASSSFSDDWLPWKVFDNNDTTLWGSQQSANPAWIGYIFDSNVCINKVVIELAVGSTYSYTGVIGYSDDGNAWVDISSTSKPLNTKDGNLLVPTYFDFANTESHRYWRIKITPSGNSTNNTATLQFYGRDEISADVSINTTGTASASSTRQQQLTIGGVATDIDGSKYMETTTYTTPSTGVRRFTFSSNAIQSTSVFDFYADVFCVSPSAVTLDTTSSTHSLAVDFNASDNVGKCRVYIRG